MEKRESKLAKALAEALDFLEEAHQDEISHKHFGDEPLPDGYACSYCRAIVEGRKILHAAGIDQSEALKWAGF